MKKSYYSLLNTIIRQMKTDGKLIINRSDLKEYLDLSEESREDIEDMCKNFMISVMAYQNNYRATIKGRSIFINVDMINNKQAMQLLVDNSDLDVKSRMAVTQRLTQLLQKMPSTDISQMAFGMDEDGNILFYDEMTDAELIETLEKLQDNTKVGDA